MPTFSNPVQAKSLLLYFKVFANQLILFNQSTSVVIEAVSTFHSHFYNLIVPCYLKVYFFIDDEEKKQSFFFFDVTGTGSFPYNSLLLFCIA